MHCLDKSCEATAPLTSICMGKDCTDHMGQLGGAFDLLVGSIQACDIIVSLVLNTKQQFK